MIMMFSIPAPLPAPLGSKTQAILSESDPIFPSSASFWSPGSVSRRSLEAGLQAPSGSFLK